MKIKIKVTKKHIKKGHRGANDSCPIYYAIQKIPELKDYYVGVNYLYDSECHNIDLPEEAAEFSRKAYHRKGKLEPFSFEIKLPKKHKKA